MAKRYRSIGVKNSTETMIGAGSGDISKFELIKEANKLIDRAEQIIKDLVAAIKLKPSGGSSCGSISGEV